jgi:hypothetical protein
LVSGGRDDDQRVVAGGTRDNPSTREWSPCDGDVQVVVGQSGEHGVADADFQVDLDVGEVLAETRQQARDEVLARGCDGAQPYPTHVRRRSLTGCLNTFIEQAEDRASVRREDLTCFRDLQATSSPLEQGDIELALQRRQGGRHCRLRDMQVLRSGAGGAHVDNRDERLEPSRGHA